MKVKFIKSATEPTEYPFPYKPEIAIVGRSNAGKSSWINAFVGQKIAKVSATPGKTRLLNFFDLEKLYLVDCPGYGFAKGSLDEALGWQGMIETYFKERKSLKGVVVIMDIRREWDEEEELLKEWLTHHGVRWALVLNKSDKLSRSQILKQLGAIKKHTADTPVFVLSAAKKTGFDEMKKTLLKEWI